MGMVDLWPWACRGKEEAEDRSVGRIGIGLLGLAVERRAEDRLWQIGGSVL